MEAVIADLFGSWGGQLTILIVAACVLMPFGILYAGWRMALKMQAEEAQQAKQAAAKSRSPAPVAH